MRDHCHITGKYRGLAHQDCNINHFRLKAEEIKILIIFHNLQGYNNRFMMQEKVKIAKKQTYKNKKLKKNR